MAVCLVPPEGEDTRVLSGERKEGGGGEEGKGEGGEEEGRREREKEGRRKERGGESGERLEGGGKEERGRRGGRRREYVGRKVGKMSTVWTPVRTTCHAK